MSELPTRPVKLGVIGGSGLYDIEGLEDTEWRHVESPFGAPSDDVLCGRLDGLDVAFLPRHGRGHTQSPSTINFRANIDVLKRLGVTDIISLSAVGSLKDGLAPGDFLIVDQFIDRTFAREKSFFGAGLVAHVSMASPVCTRLGDRIGDAAAAASDITIKRGGTYMVMEGPQFSSLAESELYRSWGCSVIGMTNMPEAKLAREAEMCYATVAMVTDYDCWHPDHDDVTVDAVIAAVHANAANARALVKHLAGTIERSRNTCAHGCDTALEFAVMTAPDARDPEMMKKLEAVAGRVIG
ncbi:MAG: S-methyl-5'-thioadenosine phosphorylase [Alphaproteobacteria bacterium]|jgi:5'-methylthioadenosine phosphorylase|nr:S-methyl-5'-thioadenosine phosphorylase [Alphaproteobacteria bacterium]